MKTTEDVFKVLMKVKKLMDKGVPTASCTVLALTRFLPKDKAGPLVEDLTKDERAETLDNMCGIKLNRRNVEEMLRTRCQKLWTALAAKDYESVPFGLEYVRVYLWLLDEDELFKKCGVENYEPNGVPSLVAVCEKFNLPIDTTARLQAIADAPKEDANGQPAGSDKGDVR